MKDTISVIVPVYNVAEYLPQCIESLLSQTYKELKIILIDDGSTDNSGDICDNYAKKDFRIQVIHQKNGGAASAKNAGLRVAKGKYISFVDSDDYLEKDAYRYMVEQLEINHADMIQCSFRNIYIDAHEDCVTLNEFHAFTAQEYLKRFTVDWTCGLIWDKLYRRKLFNGVFFEEGHKIDDEFFTYQGVMNAKKIIYMPRIIYNYRKRKSSVMLKPESQQKIILDKLDYLDIRRIKVVSSFPELKQDFDYHFLNMLLILSKENAVTEESIQRAQQLLRNYFKGEKHCKMEISLRRQLFQLQHRNPKSILKRKNTAIINDLDKQCFE